MTDARVLTLTQARAEVLYARLLERGATEIDELAHLLGWRGDVVDQAVDALLADGRAEILVFESEWIEVAAIVDDQAAAA